MTAEYLPGDRWLVATPDAMAYLHGSAAQAVELWRLLSEQASAANAVQVLLRAAMREGGSGLAHLDPFVIAVRESRMVRVLCREVDEVAACEGDTTVTPVTGRGLVGWAETLVPLPCTVTVGDPDEADLLPVPGGVVRAGAVRWRPGDRSGRRRAAATEDPVAVQSLPSSASAEPVPSEPMPAGLVPSGPVTAEPVPSEPVPSTPPPAEPVPVSTRAVEETRYELGVELDDIPGSAEVLTDVEWSPDPDDAAELEANPDGAAGAPIDAVPRSGRGGAPAAAPDPGGDHDGLTRLAEDLPIGYMPPPAGDEIPAGTVLAVLCPSGHANAPHSSSCRLCRQPIGTTEAMPVQRPVLARIRLSTGQVIDVDRPVVLGRAPYASRVAASELPHLVTVPSPHQDISRAHAQIRAADWQLLVTDLDSTNGTTVRPPGRPPQRLHPGQEVVVEPGWSVDLGDGVSLVIEAAP